MAIQQRRGAKADFDATKMLPGELAVTTDGSRKVYVAFAPGDAKELASTEDVEETIQSGIEEIGQKKEEALAQFPDYEDKLAELEVYKANSIKKASTGTNIAISDSANAPLINLIVNGASWQNVVGSVTNLFKKVTNVISGGISITPDGLTVKHRNDEFVCVISSMTLKAGVTYYVSADIRVDSGSAKQI